MGDPIPLDGSTLFENQSLIIDLTRSITRATNKLQQRFPSTRTITLGEQLVEENTAFARKDPDTIYRDTITLPPLKDGAWVTLTDFQYPYKTPTQLTRQTLITLHSRTEIAVQEAMLITKPDEKGKMITSVVDAQTNEPLDRKRISALSSVLEDSLHSLQ